MINTLPGHPPRTLLSILDTMFPVLLEIKVLEVREAINWLSLQSLDQKVRVLSQVNGSGDTIFALVIQKIPKLISELLLIIGTLAVEAQEKIFTHHSTKMYFRDSKFDDVAYRYNALELVAMKNPQAFPAALELVQKFSFPTQMVLFNLSKEFDTGFLVFLHVAERAPDTLINLLKILKKFPNEIEQKVIYGIDANGDGLESFIIYSGNSGLLKEVVAQGYIFDKKQKNKSALGLLEKAILLNDCAMLKVLVGQFGLKLGPHAKLSLAKARDLHVRYPVLRYPRIKVMSKEMQNLCNDKSQNELYDIYVHDLSRFVIAEIRLVFLGLEVRPDPAIQLIAEYVLDDVLIENIEQALKLQTKLLNPLINYCQQKDLDVEAKGVLEKLSKPERLRLDAFEAQLYAESAKEGFPAKPYARKVLECHVNTAQITHNTLKLSGKSKKIQDEIELKLKTQRESSLLVFKWLRIGIVMTLITVMLTCAAFSAYEYLCIQLLLTLLLVFIPHDLSKYSMQFFVLRANMVITSLVLVLSLCLFASILSMPATVVPAMLLTAIPEVMPTALIPAIAAGAVTLAGNIYGFYAHKKNIKVQSPDEACDLMPNALVPVH